MDDHALPPHLSELRSQLVAAAHRMRRTRNRRRRAVLIVSAAGALAGGAVAAVPPLRDQVSAFLLDGGAPPGPVAQRQEMPAWLVRLDESGALKETPRIIAQAGDLRLLAYRSTSGQPCLEYGPDIMGACGFPSSPFERSDINLTGTFAKSRHRLALWGLVRDPISTVTLTATDGTTLASADTPAGGFVIVLDRDTVVEAERSGPLTVTGRDASGNIVATESFEGWPGYGRIP